MSKRRRTRAQKQRTAQHREQLLEHIKDLAKPASAPVQAVEKPQSVEASPAPAIASKPDHGDLRTSLLIFSSLIVIQLVIWLLFRSSGIDESLYRLIKL